MDRVIAKINYPEAFQYNVNDITNNNCNDICFLSVRNQDLPVVYNYLKNNDIKAAIDNENFNYVNKPDEISLVINSDDVQKANAVIKKLANVSRKQHIYRKEAEARDYFSAPRINIDELLNNETQGININQAMSEIGVNYEKNKRQIDDAIEKLISVKKQRETEER